MKNLVIGIGGCGNNIVNLIQDKIDNDFKTVSIQKDLQLIAISKSDFKLNTKDRDFENKLNILLQNCNNAIIVIGLAGTTSILYLDKILKLCRANKITYFIEGINPLKVEGNDRLENAKTTSRYIRNITKNYNFIKCTMPNKSDEEIIESILDYSISLKNAIIKIEINKLCISDAYGIASCSTCGCKEAEKIVKKINNIEDELINYDIDKMMKNGIVFSSYRDMPKALNVIIFIFLRVRFDKEKVLNFWIENLDDKNIRFFDAILFYLLRNKPFSKDIKEKWVKKCLLLAEKYDDV